MVCLGWWGVAGWVGLVGLIGLSGFSGSGWFGWKIGLVGFGWVGWVVLVWCGWLVGGLGFWFREVAWRSQCTCGPPLHQNNENPLLVHDAMGTQRNLAGTLLAFVGFC